jgi:DNA segregation ATPase FtsK/SpoIIIE-like protein
MGRKRKILTKSRLDAIAGTFQVSLSAEIKKTLSALLLAILAVLITLSLLGLAGRFGITFQQLLFMVFGFVTYLLPIILLCILVLLVKNVDPKKDDVHPGKRTFFGSLLMLMGFLGIWHLFFVYIQDRGLWDFSVAEAGAGLLGTILSSIFLQFFGYVASAVILVGFFAAGIVILTNLALAVSLMRAHRRSNLNWIPRRQRFCRMGRASTIWC